MLCRVGQLLGLSLGMFCMFACRQSLGLLRHPSEAVNHRPNLALQRTLRRGWRQRWRQRCSGRKWSAAASGWRAASPAA